MHLKIEKGITIPETTARSGENMNLLRSMEPGDSVFFDAPIANKAPRFYRVAKKLGINIVIRRDGEGMRMWRVIEKPTRRSQQGDLAKKGDAVKAAPKAPAEAVVKAKAKSAVKQAVTKAKPAKKSAAKAKAKA